MAGQFDTQYRELLDKLAAQTLRILGPATKIERSEDANRFGQVNDVYIPITIHRFGSNSQYEITYRGAGSPYGVVSPRTRTYKPVKGTDGFNWPTLVDLISAHINYETQVEEVRKVRQAELDRTTEVANRLGIQTLVGGPVNIRLNRKQTGFKTMVDLDLTEDRLEKLVEFLRTNSYIL